MYELKYFCKENLALAIYLVILRYIVCIGKAELMLESFLLFTNFRNNELAS